MSQNTSNQTPLQRVRAHVEPRFEQNQYMLAEWSRFIENFDDTLSNLSNWDEFLLLRWIADDELEAEIRNHFYKLEK
jgi:hypothetical protein